jgi:hypothetical protein
MERKKREKKKKLSPEPDGFTGEFSPKIESYYAARLASSSWVT